MNWERWAAILAIALGASNLGKSWFVNDYRLDAVERVVQDRQVLLAHLDDKLNALNNDVSEIKGYLILKGWKPNVDHQP